MKNIKSFIYVCIAAVLVLGITACQEPLTYKTPIGLTATVDKTDYMIGEEFDPSTASVVVTYSDNSTKTFKGSELAYEFYSKGVVASGLTIEADSYVVFRYGVVATDGTPVLSNKAAVNGHKAVSIELANLPTTATIKGTSLSQTNEIAAADLQKITGVVTLDNGLTREVSAADGLTVKGTINGGTAVTTATKDVQVEYKATIYGQEPDVKAPAEGYKINVVADAGTDKDFNEEATTYYLDVVYTIDGEVVDVDSDTFYLGQKLDWKVVVKDSNGADAATKDLDKNVFVAMDNADVKWNSVDIGRKPEGAGAGDTSYSWTLKYIGDYNVGEGDTVTVTIPYGVNYIKSVSFIGLDPEYEPKEGKLVITSADVLNFDVVYGADFVTGDTAWDQTSNVKLVKIGTDTMVADKPFETNIYFTWTDIEGKTQVDYANIKISKVAVAGA